MVTDLVSDMLSILSEYPLNPDEELHKGEDDAIWIQGIGGIAQYHSYYDTLWEKNVIYFVRDYYFNELQSELEKGVRHKAVRQLIYNVNLLNSKILAHENAKDNSTTQTDTTTRREGEHPPNSNSTVTQLCTDDS